jgi:hypothetical protein
VAHLRRHVDDRSGLLRPDEPARHRLSREERRSHVQPHDGVEAFDAHLHEGLRPVHAGVVEENVVRRRALHGLLEGRQVSDVDGYGLGRSAPLANLARARFDLVVRARHEGHVSARFGKGRCCRQADAAPGPGHESALAVEAERGRGGEAHPGHSAAVA